VPLVLGPYGVQKDVAFLGSAERIGFDCSGGSQLLVALATPS